MTQREKQKIWHEYYPPENDFVFLAAADTAHCHFPGLLGTISAATANQIL